MRAIRSLPLLTMAPSLLESTAILASEIFSPFAAACSALTAGFITDVWNAPETASGRTRDPSGGFSASRSRAARSPAATI